MSRERVEAELRDYARLQVRAGLLSPTDQEREVAEAVAAELPGLDASVLARAWLAAARADLSTEQATWERSTDHDRLAQAFAQCEAHRIVVLPGVVDHWAVQAELDRRAGDQLRGALWFTPPDVWHAIDAGMLELDLWYPDGANIAPGDGLLAEVLAIFADAGLTARFDEGRIEVDARWHRRLES